MAEQLPERFGQMDLNLRQAFLKNTSRSLAACSGAGRWAGTAAPARDIFIIREAIAHHVQVWNDVYTDPAGAKQDGRAPERGRSPANRRRRRSMSAIAWTAPAIRPTLPARLRRRQPGPGPAPGGHAVQSRWPVGAW